MVNKTSLLFVSDSFGTGSLFFCMHNEFELPVLHISARAPDNILGKLSHTESCIRSTFHFKVGSIIFHFGDGIAEMPFPTIHSAITDDCLSGNIILHRD